MTQILIVTLNRNMTNVSTVLQALLSLCKLLENEAMAVKQ